MPSDFPTPIEELTVTRTGSPGLLGFGSDTGRLDLQGWRRHGSALTTLGDGRAMGFDPTARSTVRMDAGIDRHDAFPTLVLHGTSSLSCFYRSGTAHIAPGGEIRRQDSNDLGATWSAPVTVFSDGQVDLRDPSVRIVGGGDWVISYFSYDSVANRPQVAMVARSTDGGATWGAPVTLTAFSAWSAVSDGVIDLGSGVLLLSVYGQDTGARRQSARIVRSTDGGATWAPYSTAADGDADGRDYPEPSLVRLASGTVRCVLRTSEDCYYYTDSTDGGRTWGPRIPMFAADGSPFLRILASGRVLLLYRSVTKNRPVALRTADATMSVWTGEQVLETVNGNFSTYSEAAELEPGVVAVAYGYQGPTKDSSRVYLAWIAGSAAGLPGGVEAPSALAAGGLSVLGSAPVHIGEPDDYLFGDQRATTRALMVRAGAADAANSQSRLYLVGNTQTWGAPLGGVAFGQAGQQAVSAAISACCGTKPSYGSLEIGTAGDSGKNAKPVLLRAIRVDERGSVLVGEGVDSPNNTRGLTIDQGENKDQVLTLRSTGAVSQPMTQLAEQTAFFTAAKVDSTGGGTQLRAFRGAGDTPVALAVAGHTAGPADTTKAAASRAVVELYASRISGSGVGNLGTDENAFALRGRVGGADAALVIVDAAGDQHHPTPGSGIVLVSPDGTKRARISLDNSGTLVTTRL